MKGHKLLLLRPMLVDNDDPTQFKPGSNTIVAVDNLGVGRGEMVLFVQGSSARQVTHLKELPIDASICAIVDSVDVLGANIYNAHNDKG